MVTPVKYAFGANVRISSVPGSSGIAGPGIVEVAAVFAAAELMPMPRNTTTVPVLMMRYWFAPAIVEYGAT